MGSKSRHLVDPELLDVLDRERHTIEINYNNLAEVRAAWRDPWFEVTSTSAAQQVHITKVSIEGPAGAPQVPIRIYRPKSAHRSGAIFHIHGGGYVGGDAAVLEPEHRNLCSELGCVLISVDYRLAPETRFPGNIEDCYAALRWMFSHATDLHLDKQRIGVMGESAGGGLAAALALMARDRGELRLAFQHLTYPMLDDRTCNVDENQTVTGEFIWTASNNHFGWEALLGAPPGGVDVSPYAAAARAENLSDLPATFLLTAALDLFVDENLEYAQRLVHKGVSVELHVYPGAFHGFDCHPRARIAQDARQVSRAALARFLRGT